jgi:integrase
VSVEPVKTAKGVRWKVRWREGNRQRSKRFASKTAARAFEAKRTLDPSVAQHRPQTTVQQIVDAYLAGIGGLRPKTQDAYRYDAHQVVSAFGDRLASGLLPSEVRAWAARPDVSSTVRQRSLMMLRRCYKLAIADRLLTTDPTVGISSAKVQPKTMRFLTWAELERLASEAGEWAPLILLLGTTGLRLGEALGLEQNDVDRVRNRIRVRRSWSVSSAGSEIGPTKTAKEREVPVRGWLMDMLPTKPGPLFVGARGDRLDPHSWRSRVFKPAAVRAGLGDMHPHELRHTAASLAVVSGADAGDVQKMLGHASAAMTLDLYRGHFSEHLDEVAQRMERARDEALEQAGREV